MTTRRRISAAIAVVAATLAVAAPSALARATDGTISGIAGTTAGFAGDGGPANQAKLDAPSDVAFVATNSYLIADFNNNRIRQVMPNGNILTVAGSDPGSFGDGGPAIAAGLDHPEGVTSLGGGAYLIADTRNHEIRRVGADGIITTFAGTDQGLAGDGGPATAARLSLPSDTALLADGSVAIADTGNDRIRRVAPNGIISTIAGTSRGFSGDGGPATAAQLNQPRDLTVASDGSILIADTGNNRIRRIAPNGIISTVAGAGLGFGGDGDPAQGARLDAPTSIVALAHGGYLVADSANNRIRRITPLGAIFTVAGSAPGNAGNGGLAKGAELNDPGAITADPNGGFLVADTANATVRRVSDVGAVPPAVVGHSIAVAPTASGVTVKPSGMAGFLPLQEEDLVPVGSQVDAVEGPDRHHRGARLARVAADGAALLRSLHHDPERRFRAHGAVQAAAAHGLHQGVQGLGRAPRVRGHEEEKEEAEEEAAAAAPLGVRERRQLEDSHGLGLGGRHRHRMADHLALRRHADHRAPRHRAGARSPQADHAARRRELPHALPLAAAARQLVRRPARWCARGPA